MILFFFFYIIDNDVDGETVDIGMTESMISFLFEGSFKKTSKIPWICSADEGDSDINS